MYEYASGSRMLAPVRTVAPKPLLTIAEVQTHLRVDSTYDDDFVKSLVDMVVQFLDGWSGVLGLCLITQTWTIKWDSFPWRRWHGEQRLALRGWPMSSAAVIRIPLNPVQSVVVTYYDTNNALQTLSNTIYGLYDDEQGWFIALNTGQSWPLTYDRPDAVTVTAVCGYGATPDSVPYPIRHAAKMLISNWYENRSAVGSPTAEVDILLAPYRRSITY